LKKHKPLLEVEGLNCALSGQTILKDITFSMDKNDFIGIVGPNGAGKSTLVRILIGEIRSYKGIVRLNGRYGYVPQIRAFDRDFPITSAEVAQMGLYRINPLSFWKKRMDRRMDQLFEKVGIGPLRHKTVGTLSGGEYQRLILVRAMLYRPDILILDEPEAGIDEMGKASFYNLLDEYRKELNVAILMISHDIGMIFEKCDRILCLNKTLHCHKQAKQMSVADLKEIFSPDFDLLIRGKDHFHQAHQ